MQRITVTLIIGLLLLAACAGPAVEQAEAPTATPTAPPPAGPAVVAPDEDTTGKLSARPLDPQTLDDLPGRDAVDFGHHYTDALSPDGQTMALIAWPAGSHSQDGALRLVELSAWRVIETGVSIDGYVSSLHFSRDGRALYWTRADLRDTAHAVPRDYRLFRYDVAGAEDAEAVTVAALPPSFTPWAMRMLPAGERLVIYGIPTYANNLAQGPPRVLLVNLVTGETAADVALEGVTAGQFQAEVETEEENPYRLVRPALAWDMAGRLLYVVHGDENKVTVVDLADGVVLRQAEVRPQTSLLERMVGWGVKTAEAKVVPSADKRAALSRDGRRLFVTGLRRQIRPDWNAQGWPYDETPLGLQVIDADTLGEVARLDLPVSDLALAPDGRRLLAAGAYNAPNADGGSERVAHGVYLLDVASLDVVARVLPEQDVTLRGFSPDGRRAYVSTATSEWLDGHGHRNWRTTLHVLDLETGLLTAERELPGSFLDVVATPAN